MVWQLGPKSIDDIAITSELKNSSTLIGESFPPGFARWANALGLRRAVRK